MQHILHRALLHRFAAPAVLVCSLVSALVLQHVLGWIPCPLCIIQRLTAIGLLLVLGGYSATASKRNVRAYFLGAAALFAAGGLVAGGAHVWLLLQPDTGACGPGLARFVAQLVDEIPGSAWLLEGAGACEDVRYKIFGIPLPAWSMLTHAAAFAVAAYQFLRTKRQN